MVFKILMGFYLVFSIFHLYRIYKGPSIWDRLLAYNLLSATIIIMILLYGLMTKEYFYLDIAIVYSLLGFIGVLFVSRFVQRKGKI